MELSALMVVRNEEDVVEKAIELIHPYVDEIIFVDMESTDRTREIASKFSKCKIYDYPYTEPLDMGKARTFSLNQATGDWFLQIDADEYYPPKSMEKILEAIQDTDAYSFRVKYYNVAWRWGYVEPIEHYPDRLYRREVVQGYEGVLPLDMTVVKPEYRSVPVKGKGMEGVLEYDNVDDHSFEHPRQPIRKDIIFYHLARARGYNYEYNKKIKYEKNTHPNNSPEEQEVYARNNQWVNGLYTMEPHEFPDIIPKRIIPNPKVSIVIPCYNYAQYIGECIESCLNQSQTPFEIIVVDDGSTDNSREVIAQYPVRLIQQANAGVAHARNRGIQASSGDYFICIDADDKLHPEYIQKTIDKMQEGEVEVVFTDMEIFGDINYVHHYPEFSIEELRKNQIIPSTCALVDRRCADPYGIFDPTAWYEDYDFWLNLAIQKGYRFKQVHEPLFLYRRKQGSRIEMLDKNQKEGFEQLKTRWGKII
jgi:glycosyltransferase involved in cell wall biosynthesis